MSDQEDHEPLTSGSFEWFNLPDKRKIHCYTPEIKNGARQINTYAVALRALFRRDDVEIVETCQTEVE